MLIGDCNAHYVRWSLEGKSDPPRRVLKECMRELGVRLMRGREYTFGRYRSNGVVVV